MKLLDWLRRRRFDDLPDEIQSHIEEKTDALIASGMSRADAEREAAGYRDGEAGQAIRAAA